MAEYIPLGKLGVYQISIKVSKNAWVIYERMDWQLKKIIGDQFIRSTDSVGANIAEGYGRFHYLDKIKFYYNARGSLFEVKHWLFLLRERQKITKEEFNNLLEDLEILHRRLNKFISSSYPKK